MLAQAYAALSALSRRYSAPQGRSPTCYSPVRHSLSLSREDVRLACVRHAASVYPEPGSNSPSIGVCLPRRRCRRWGGARGVERSRPSFLSTWLFRRCYVMCSRANAAAMTGIDRNCCTCNSCCSAFHFSIGKVPVRRWFLTPSLYIVYSVVATLTSISLISGCSCIMSYL